MDPFYFYFPVSGVKTWVFLPPLVAFGISLITSMGGVSGAFVILPFQVSILKFTSPAVSSTNLLFNIVAIPSGVYRYIKEGRMAWPLAWIIILGTLPGVLVGYYIRVLYLPDPRAFKLFVGCVLLYIGIRLLLDLLGRSKNTTAKLQSIRVDSPDPGQTAKSPSGGDPFPALSRNAVIQNTSFSLLKVEFEFRGQSYSFSTGGMFFLAIIVGIIGGTYGIGGGAIIAPFCVTIFRLPVYTVAGAALLGTFLTSIAGVVFYSVIQVKAGVATSPDWFLGILFGAGGLLGMYCGARLQKFIPEKFIKLLLGTMITLLAARYIFQFFLR